MDSVEIGKISIPAIRGEKGENGNAGVIKELKIKMLDTTDSPTIENTGTEEEAIIEIGIPKGDDIVEANINENGDLIFKTESQKTFNVGTVKGTGISNVIIIDNNLVVRLTNGSEINLGNIKGDKGDTGEKGEDGFSPTITEKVNSNDEYILEITDKEGTYETPNLKEKDKTVYFWNLKTDETGLELWQKVYDDSKAGKLVYVYGQVNTNVSDNQQILFYIINQKFENREIIYDKIPLNVKRISDLGKNSYYRTTRRGLRFTIESDEIKSINQSYYNFNGINYLATDQDYQTPYEPLYDGSPATKKYVDDRLNNFYNIGYETTDEEKLEIFQDVYNDLINNKIVYLIIYNNLNSSQAYTYDFFIINSNDLEKMTSPTRPRPVSSISYYYDKKFSNDKYNFKQLGRHVLNLLLIIEDNIVIDYTLNSSFKGGIHDDLITITPSSFENIKSALDIRQLLWTNPIPNNNFNNNLIYTISGNTELSEFEIYYKIDINSDNIYHTKFTKNNPTTLKSGLQVINSDGITAMKLYERKIYFEEQDNGNIQIKVDNNYEIDLDDITNKIQEDSKMIPLYLIGVKNTFFN